MPSPLRRKAMPNRARAIRHYRCEVCHRNKAVKKEHTGLSVTAVLILTVVFLTGDGSQARCPGQPSVDWVGELRPFHISLPRSAIARGSYVVSFWEPLTNLYTKSCNAFLPFCVCLCGLVVAVIVSIRTGMTRTWTMAQPFAFKMRARRPTLLGIIIPLIPSNSARQLTP